MQRPAESGGRVQSDLHLGKEWVRDVQWGPAQQVCSHVWYFSGSHSALFYLSVTREETTRAYFKFERLRLYVWTYGSTRPICALWRSSRRGHGWVHSMAQRLRFAVLFRPPCMPPSPWLLRAGASSYRYSTPPKPKDTFCALFAFAFRLLLLSKGRRPLKGTRPTSP